MKKIIIIGANNFQLPLIRKAKEMELETHVFAWAEGAIGKEYADYFYPISITEKEIILEKAKQIKPDAVLSIASDLAIITVNYLTSKLGLIGNSLDCTEVTTNKYLMRKRLLEYSLPCPKFTNNSKSELTDFSFPLIIKPTDRSGSRGISIVNSKKDLKCAVEQALDESFNKQVIIEEFIYGKEYSVEMISWKGEHNFLQITEKETSGAPYFIEKEQHQPANISNDKKEEVIEIIKKSLDALEVKNGASHSEIIINDHGKVYITEIGARMGGDYIGSDLVELSTGFDFVKAVIEVSLNIRPEIELSSNYFSGIYYTFAPKGRVSEIINHSKKFTEIIRNEVYCAKGDQIPEIRESGVRPACFIYQSVNKRFIPNQNIIKIVTK
jgi:biotin carboxylase